MIRSHLATDWLEDLREFPAEVVAEAVRDYRRSEDHRRRPLPGDIRLLCLAIVQRQREDRERRDRPKAIPDMRAQREIAEARSLRYREAAEARDQFARELGYEDSDALMADAHRQRGGMAAILRRHGLSFA